MKKQSNIIKKLKYLIKENPNLNINELRIIVALERLVARIESDNYLSKHIVFKGGFVLFKVLSSSRFTRDLDALAIGIDKQVALNRILNIIKTDLNDELWFCDIRQQFLEAEGVRFSCAFQI